MVEQYSDSINHSWSDGAHEDRCGEFVDESERIHDAKTGKERYVQHQDSNPPAVSEDPSWKH